MSLCHCIKIDGSKCTRTISHKQGDDFRFCWQHQNCKIIMPENKKIKVSLIKKDTASKKIPVALIKKSNIIHPSRQLVNLSGASYFSFYPNLNGQRLLLLGEHHQNKGTCDVTLSKLYSVGQWLLDLARQAPECLDIFIEQSYITETSVSKIPSSSSSQLGQTKYLFKDCHTKLASNCKISNQLRYHFIDLRSFKSVSKSPQLSLYLSHKVPTLMEAANQIESKYFNQRELLYKYVSGMDRTSIAQNLYNQYIQDIAHKLNTSYSDSSYMPQFYKLIDKELNKIFVPVLEFYQIILKIFMKETNLWLALFILPQDIYFLARLLIQFDPRKMNRGPIGCRSRPYQRIKNAIVLVGSHHAQVYNQFVHLYFQVNPRL